jgi:hypothetical protein
MDRKSTRRYDRDAVRQTLGTSSLRSYADAMAGLWIDLRTTLARLDALAGDLDRLGDEREALPGLQYELHRASELVAGLTPPGEAQSVHDELADALAEARETTAEIGEALALGGIEAAAPLVWEWRGVLFRVRFARVRLERGRPRRVTAVAVVPQDRPRTPPVLAAGAVAVGTALVLVAALLGLWLLVGLTLTGTVAASILLRP